MSHERKSGDERVEDWERDGGLRNEMQDMQYGYYGPVGTSRDQVSGARWAELYFVGFAGIIGWCFMVYGQLLAVWSRSGEGVMTALIHGDLPQE